jgi:hypothetical protein
MEEQVKIGYKNLTTPLKFAVVGGLIYITLIIFMGMLVCGVLIASLIMGR